MHLHDTDVFLACEPGVKRIHCVPKALIGIHERWSGDGHDKLYEIGFLIWAVIDDATARWLAAWVVPSNRMGDVIGYFFFALSLNTKRYVVASYPCIETEVEFRASSPIYYRLWFRDNPTLWACQCSSVWFPFCNNLIYHPETHFPAAKFFILSMLPAHWYLRSVYNISIEWSWLWLQLDFGDNAVVEYQQGPPSGNFKPEDPVHL